MSPNPRRHHADDRKRDALHHELTAQNISSTEVLAPEAMADDGDGAIQRRGSVVGWREHPPSECPHAEHVEELPADVCAVHNHWPAAIHKIEALTRPGPGAGERVACTTL